MPGEKSKHKDKGKKSKDKPAELPEHLEKQRKYVICGPDKNYHVRPARRGQGRPARAAQRWRRCAPLPAAAARCHPATCSGTAAAALHPATSPSLGCKRRRRSSGAAARAADLAAPRAPAEPALRRLRSSRLPAPPHHVSLMFSKLPSSPFTDVDGDGCQPVHGAGRRQRVGLPGVC